MRWLIVLLVAGVVVTLGVLFGPGAWRNAQLWYWQRACMSYEAPAGQVVCQEAPSWAGHTPPFLQTAPTPTPLSEYEALGGARTIAPVLYMGERTTAGGRRRLVIVRRVPPMARQSWDVPKGLDVAVEKPRRVFRSDEGSLSTWTQEIDRFPRAFESAQDTPSLTIYAGRSDPHDPSRFTIDYDAVDGGGTLEGTLVDPSDADQSPRVEWRMR